MKKILLSVLLIASLAYASNVNAQCSVAEPGVTIHSSKDTLGTQCVITFDLNFKLQYNGGNKIVVIQSWLEADYPNFWNCGATHDQTGSHNAPKANDLKLNGTGPLPFFDLAFNNDVTPPVPLTTYGPDNTVPLITGYTITRGSIDANGFQSFMISNIRVLLPSPCGTGVSIRTDLWSSDGAINSQWKPHCINCNNLFAFNYPRVSGDILCGSPNRYHIRIENINTSQTIVISGWKAFLDNAPAGVYGNEDVLADDQSSNSHTLAPGAVFEATLNYSYLKADAAKNLWLVVTTQGLPNTQNALITGGCSPLPVLLNHFTAKRTTSSNVSLTWQTAQEINSKGFEIQRLIGAGGWQAVGFVASQALYGNSSSTLNYSFNDNNNAHAITQYRLKEVDIDANSKFSEIRAVRGDGQAGKIIVYPNPSFDGTAKVVFEEINGTRDVSLSDASGRLIKQWKGVANNNLAIDNLTPGFYSLRVVIRETGEQSIEKIIVNKR